MTYDYLVLDIDSKIPLYQQLYLSLKKAIEAGHLAKGMKLPSIRKLSEDLGLSRTTIESAYQQLCVEGYIRSSPQRGYFIQTEKRTSSVPQKQTFSSPRTVSPKIRYNFGTDFVDSSNIDIKIWKRHIRDVLNRQEVIASYGDPQGEPALREALAQYSYGVRGVHTSAEQIVIGAGIQPLLTILCGLLRGHPSVAMEEHGFLQAERVFSDCGMRVRYLPADEDGIEMDALKRSGAKVVLLSPSNRIHTGATIPMSRRFALLEWAKQSGSILIEDDYNGELRYRARPIPAMQGMDGGENVVYIGSFSKLLLPSVRIGYMVLPDPLLERYLPRARSYNQTSSKIEQLALAGYIKSGQLERHLRRLRKLYAAKASALIRELEAAFDGHARIILQETALRLILRLDPETDAQTLCRLALEHGVRVQPTENEPACITLGFAGIPLEQIPAAVECLKNAWEPCK